MNLFCFLASKSFKKEQVRLENISHFLCKMDSLTICGSLSWKVQFTSFICDFIRRKIFPQIMNSKLFGPQLLRRWNQRTKKFPNDWSNEGRAWTWNISIKKTILEIHEVIYTFHEYDWIHLLLKYKYKLGLVNIFSKYACIRPRRKICFHFFTIASEHTP